MQNRIKEERALRMRQNAEAEQKWNNHQTVIDGLLTAKFNQHGN